MWANRFSGSLHSCDIYKEMDIYILAFLKFNKKQKNSCSQRDDMPNGHSGLSSSILNSTVQGLKSC